jgi:hypothetical protein
VGAVPPRAATPLGFSFTRAEPGGEAASSRGGEARGETHASTAAGAAATVRDATGKSGDTRDRFARGIGARLAVSAANGDSCAQMGSLSGLHARWARRR